MLMCSGLSRVVLLGVFGVWVFMGRRLFVMMCIFWICVLSLVLSVFIRWSRFVKFFFWCW